MTSMTERANDYRNRFTDKLQARFGLVGVEVFDTFVAACLDRRPQEVLYMGYQGDFLAQIGMPCRELVSDAGDPWSLDDLLQFTGNNKLTRRIRVDGTITAVRCDGFLRRARHRRAYIPVAVRRFVFERDEYRCVECGSEDRLQLDHIHPWSRGGKETADNLQVLCQPCNIRKGNKVAA